MKPLERLIHCTTFRVCIVCVLGAVAILVASLTAAVGVPPIRAARAVELLAAALGNGTDVRPSRVSIADPARADLRPAVVTLRAAAVRRHEPQERARRF